MYPLLPLGTERVAKRGGFPVEVQFVGAEKGGKISHRRFHIRWPTFRRYVSRQLPGDVGIAIFRFTYIIFSLITCDKKRISLTHPLSLAL